MLKIHWLTNSNNLPMGGGGVGGGRPTCNRVHTSGSVGMGIPMGIPVGMDGYGDWNAIPTAALYAIPDKEGLAVFWAVNKFYKYLFGSRFIIQTDCQALTILNGKPSKNPRILRWQIFLQGFDYTIQVIRGADNGLADFLSRNGVE